MVDPRHPRLSIVRQCTLVSIARSSFYYEGKGESPLNLVLMRLIDEQYLETPWYGWRGTCGAGATVLAASGCAA
jgi:putative transposase